MMPDEEMTSPMLDEAGVPPASRRRRPTQRARTPPRDRRANHHGPGAVQRADRGAQRLSGHFGGKDKPSRLARLEVQEVVVGTNPSASTEPSSARMVRSRGTPVAMASSPLAIRCRASPWTGKTLRGRTRL